MFSFQSLKKYSKQEYQIENFLLMLNINIQRVENGMVNSLQWNCPSPETDVLVKIPKEFVMNPSSYSKWDM